MLQKAQTDWSPFVFVVVIRILKVTVEGKQSSIRKNLYLTSSPIYQTIYLTLPKVFSVFVIYIIIAYTLAPLYIKKCFSGCRFRLFNPQWNYQKYVWAIRRLIGPLIVIQKSSDHIHIAQPIGVCFHTIVLIWFAK